MELSKVGSEELLNKIYTEQFSYNTLLPGPFGDRYITYADYVASGQSLKFIEQFIEQSVLPSYANTHTESSYTGLQTTKLREESRAIIRASVNAKSEDAVIFAGSGSTGAIDLLNRKLTQNFDDQSLKPVVLIGPYEHHSNILPWREGSYELIELSMNKNGNIDMLELENQLKKHSGKRTVIGSFSAASNVTGILAPVLEIHRLLKRYGALSFWDFAAAAPYIKMDMNPEGVDGIDAIFISTHKFVGGPCTPGLLIIKKYLLNSQKPAVPGGGTVTYVTKNQQQYITDLEGREEGGTPSIIASIRAGLAFKLKETVGVQTIQKLESEYIQRALTTFVKNTKIKILGDLNSDRLSFFSFLIKYKGQYLHYNFVVALLNDLFGIQSRGGCSCAGPYGHDLLNLDAFESQLHTNQLEKGISGSKPGWVRVNFNYFIPNDEFEYILNAIEWISHNGWRLLNHYDFDYESGIWTCNAKRIEVGVSLNDFLTEKSVLKKGTTTERKNSWISNFTIANTLADEVKKKQVFSNVNAETQWYPLSRELDSEEQSSSFEIFSPWKSITRKIHTLSNQ